MPRLSFSEACGIFPMQKSNPCPLNWQADSLPLSHQGGPKLGVFDMSFHFIWAQFSHLRNGHSDACLPELPRVFQQEALSRAPGSHRVCELVSRAACG